VPARVNLACVKATEEQDLLEDSRCTRELFLFRSFLFCWKRLPAKDDFHRNKSQKGILVREGESEVVFPCINILLIFILSSWLIVTQEYSSTVWPTEGRRKVYPWLDHFLFHYFDFDKMIRWCSRSSISNRALFIFLSSWYLFRERFDVPNVLFD
jgi:hypothetical protein